MAKLLKFTPKDRQGDPDFPGIPALAHFYRPPAKCFYRPPAKCRECGKPAVRCLSPICLDCAVAGEPMDAIDPFESGGAAK